MLPYLPKSPMEKQNIVSSLFIKVFLRMGGPKKLSLTISFSQRKVYKQPKYLLKIFLQNRHQDIRSNLQQTLNIVFTALKKSYTSNNQPSQNISWFRLGLRHKRRQHFVLFSRNKIPWRIVLGKYFIKNDSVKSQVSRK